MDSSPLSNNQIQIRSPFFSLTNRNFIFLLLAIFFLIVAAAVGFFYFTKPTSGPTNKFDTSDKGRGGEKSFINKGYGFTISYDSNNFRTGAQVKTNDKASYFQYCPLNNLEMCSEPINIVQVNILENSRRLSLLDFLKLDPASPVYIQGKILCYFNDSRTQINPNDKFKGEDAITYRFNLDAKTSAGACKDQEIEGSGIYEYIFVSKNGRIYWASIRHATEETLPILEKFLDGFSFN